MSGWIRLNRSIFSDDDFVTTEPMTEREAWIWLIANVAWKDTKHRIGAELVKVERGSGYFTLRGLQSAFNWKSNNRVGKFLETLKNHEKIGVKTAGKAGARKTLVTICNYDKYQQAVTSPGARRGHDGGKTGAQKKQGNDEQGKPNGFPAREARKTPDRKSGWVEKKTAVDALNSFLSRLDSYDEQEGTGNCREGTDLDVRVIPAIGSGKF